MGISIEIAEFCADYCSTFEVVGSKGDKYEVHFNPDGSSHCTCKGFEFRKTCRHVSEVFSKGCFYNPQWNGGGTREMKPKSVDSSSQLPGRKCPACGGPVIPVKIAV